MSSVLASISLVRAKLGRYVLVLAKVVRVCVLVCDVGNPRVGGGVVYSLYSDDGDDRRIF